MPKLIVILLSLLWVFSQGSSAGAAESYPLSVRDRVSFSVLNEPETETEQRIDGEGRIRLPYIGTVRIAGLTVRQAEVLIERAYVAGEVYIDPQIAVRIVEYAANEVSVLGEVNQPGTVAFPIEAVGLDIREVISQAGGFTNIAKSSAVMVTRQTGAEKTTFTVDVDDMLSKKGAEAEVFIVQPGDVVFVPERFF